MRRFALTLALALTCCDNVRLPTATGEHVTYHWDASEEHLCGGTVPMVDRFMEMIAAHYGRTPAEIGPGIEYFWDPELALSACSSIDDKACAGRHLNRSIVFADSPVNTHELGHTARGGLGYPAFINEAFASRWESALLEPGTAYRTTSSFLSAAELRTALDADRSPDVNYAYAFTWWVALETSYGPAKMAEFINELEGAASSDDVELATQGVFGISLAESAALAERLPAARIDDPACELEGLPAFAWTGGPIVLERGGDRCEDDGIVNLGGRRVIWLFALEFPETPSIVDVKVTVPYGEDPKQKGVYMVWCDGELGIDEPSPFYNARAGHPGTQRRLWSLRGRYVGALLGVIEADASVVFPRVAFEEVQL